ncbi:hypothetical protein [Enterococcus hermanniensis]|uniref:Uncharacterized protein n=1 Tax=Enterococcus hermanniensis TaxID=249189 RepID=A0A1L8TQE1_9ENTE|nr:hypothetical protein [Enterococcus hermanniensis]OJG46539.1 hypothetical protein RV04_GL000967 [Enterococcus hermanniensis]
MKKIAGYFFKKPLNLDDKKAFEVQLPSNVLYSETQNVLKSDHTILTAIGKKYEHPLETLHNFFVISEITDVE